MSILNRALNKVKQLLNRPKLIRCGDDRDLYKTKEDLYFWLSKNKDAYIDSCMKNTGVFEFYSTEVVKKFIKEDSVVIDVGANIGYYSVIFSKLVGGNGKVLSFEPTAHFYKILSDNLKENKCDNVRTFSFGLSDKQQTLDIYIGDSSATIHDPTPETAISKEAIKLFPLDEKIVEFNLSRLDFIKIDIDGHEPAFLKGAIKTIRKFKPLVLLEVSHTHYLEYGVTAWDFYSYLKDEGFFIYRETNLSEIRTKQEFLRECGNFTTSSNILLSYSSL
jgi:FkbM family methyltransferase